MRHEAQDRYRITFTTDLPVFSFATQSGFNSYDVETNPAMAIRQRHQEDIQRASSLSDRWKP
ncbi:hypothetical protein HMPREF1314_1442 [Bifidobacterium longum subsp. longum 35B]|nr:hypothetical protein HMPREF1314_1442 [Bifidobacterium longum subsp. longum 35B]